MNDIEGGTEGDIEEIGMSVRERISERLRERRSMKFKEQAYKGGNE